MYLVEGKINKLLLVIEQATNLWLSNIFSFHKMKILTTSCFYSKFSYCPLIWLGCSCTSNDKINRLRESLFSMFEELLRKDNSVTIRVRNIQLLAPVMYKLKNNLTLICVP